MESEGMQDVEPGSFKPFEVSAPHLIYVGLGFFIVIFGMLSLFIKEKLYLGEAPIAAVFGIIVGPAALNLFNPSKWANNDTRAPGGHITDEITLEVMRVTIALSVFAVGVELPKKYLLRHWRSIILLLGPVMLWGWMITAAFIVALVPGLDFLNALVVAACVTPTDPILAQAVVGGPWAEKHVPAHLRYMLQCESGCNDGAAFPFLYLALFLTVHRDNTGKAIAEWFYDALAYQIIFGTLLGALIGWAARKAMRFAEKKKLVDRESFVAQYVSLAIASMGVNVLLGSDDLLAAFACGTAFAWDGWFTKQTEDSNFSNIVDLLFNCATFIYIGALMPWYQFAHAAGSLNIWRCFVLAICVLATKRIPIILALWRWIPDIKTFREAIFSGHFGPIGVGAIFIATLGRTELPEEVNDPPQNSNDVLALTIQPIVFFFVLCSITVHGLTIPFFAFSKRATTITRTWSRHPSFADGGEPGWLNRMRRFRTGDTMQSQKEVEGGGMSEIRRVLDAQLGVIGKGAIGGDAEDELRRIEEDSGEGSGESSGNGGDSSSGSRTRVGLINTRTERDLELAEGDGGDGGRGRGRDDDVDDLDDWQADEAEDPACEWGGDDTAEARRYKAKRAAARLERHRKEEQRKRQDDGDLGEAPMDREMEDGRIRAQDEDDDVRREEEERHRHRDRLSSYGCDSRDEEEKDRAEQATSREKQYPKARSWLEGRKLLIEYMPSRLGEPEVHVVCLDEEEAEELAKQRQAQGGEEGDAVDEDFSAAHAWLATHREELDEHVEGNSHHEWGPMDSALELVRSGALQKWLHSSGNGGGRRDKQGDKKEEKVGADEKAKQDEKEKEKDQSRNDGAAEDRMPRTDTQDSRRIPGISVSFLNNDDTAHDRAARGNTHGNSSSHHRLSSLLNPFTSSNSNNSSASAANNMNREASSSSGGNGSPAISRRTSLDDQSARQRGEHGAAYPGARTRTHLEREDTPNEGILAAPPSPGGGTSTPSGGGGGSVAFDKLPTTSR